ncbi:Porin [Hyphomicrobiales bacterium]|nr:Porin [Hyphomicrobiales bacterium]CAH1688801.1 Porin [Hyphomicrobiales bacterium]
MIHPLSIKAGWPDVAVSCLLAFTSLPAHAADAAPAIATAEPSSGAGVFGRERLTGDWSGARTRLEDAGITFGLRATGDLSTDVSGGLQQGSGFSGLLQLDVDFDLEKLVGWQGGAFHAGAFFIGGLGLSGKYIGNLMPISSIEADPAGRLAELYFMQTFFDGRLSLKVGQIAADGEFATSDTAGLFVNSAFGWPGLNGIVLPGGGPAYPVPAPGIRVAYQFNEAWMARAGVYSGNPLGRDDQNRHGLTFPLNQGIFAIGEVAYTQVFADGLAGTYTVGGWYDSMRFNDQRISANGLPLAAPDGDTDPRGHRGNFALYGVIDQTLWRASDADLTGRSLAAFARLVVAPQKDRSTVDFYMDSGLTFTGLLPGRTNDVVGVAVAYAGVSPSLQRLDRDMIAFTGEPRPIRSSEVVIEASYQAQFAPWLKVQPFAQWIVRPGGGEPDPETPWRRIPNATVLGLRSVAVF